jgi:hypothetical protein
MGAGRRPQKNAVPWTDEKPATRPAQAPVHAAEVPGVVRPEMDADVGAFWDELAPLALEQGTLVPATALEFRLLCEVAVQQQRALRNIASGYGAYSNLTKILEGKLRSFKLAPMGKEIAAPPKEKPMTALERLKMKGRGLHAVK